MPGLRPRLMRGDELDQVKDAAELLLSAVDLGALEHDAAALLLGLDDKRGQLGTATRRELEEVLDDKRGPVVQAARRELATLLRECTAEQAERRAIATGPAVVDPSRYVDEGQGDEHQGAAAAAVQPCNDYGPEPPGSVSAWLAMTPDEYFAALDGQVRRVDPGEFTRFASGSA